jgi:hypothetical protein
VGSGAIRLVTGCKPNFKAMTTQELNRDIKRLLKEDSLYASTNKAVHLDNIRREFVRLYMADQYFQYMNRTSILIMLRLNLRYRFVALHSFGVLIETNTL